MSPDAWTRKSIDWAHARACLGADIERVRLGKDIVFAFVRNGVREALIVYDKRQAKKARAWLERKAR